MNRKATVDVRRVATPARQRKQTSASFRNGKTLTCLDPNRADDYTPERWLTSAAYDGIGAEANAQIISEGIRTSSGSYNFRLFHPNDVETSVCHTFKVYQDGEFVGEAFGGGQNDIGEE